MSDERTQKPANPAMNNRAASEAPTHGDWLDVFGSTERLLYWLDDTNFEKEHVQ